MPELRERPAVTLQPAIMKIDWELERKVFWCWNTTFTKAKLQDNKIIALEDNRADEPVIVGDAFYYDVGDPTPLILKFLDDFRTASSDPNDYLRIDTDYGLQDFVLEYWSIDEVNCHVCFSCKTMAWDLMIMWIMNTMNTTV